MRVVNITAAEAYGILTDSSSALNSVLVDVRTSMEWEAGTPSVPKGNIIFLSWAFLPDMAINTNFLSELESKVPDKETKLFFLCRSGARSMLAAELASSSGYVNCYNISDGFVGNVHGIGWENVPFLDV